MTNKQYFCWQDHIRIVNGARRAAVYDLKIGSVYSIDEHGRQMIEELLHTQPVHRMALTVQQFLSQMVELELGYFSDAPQPAPLPEDKLPAVPLNFLWLELTGSCNLQCQHCYADSGPHKKVTEPVQLWSDMEEIPLHNVSQPKQKLVNPNSVLTPEKWLDIIAQAADQGCRQIQFIGGEPLLYKSLLKLIDAAVEADFTYIEVFTNGTLLTKEMVQSFAERGVRIAISLHGGTAETQDRISQRDGSFAKVLEGLKLLKEHQVSTRLATTVTNVNQHELEALQEIAQHHDVAKTSHDIVRTIGRGFQELLPTDLAVYESKWLTEPEFGTSYESYMRNKGWNTCWSGRLAITNGGHVIPCVFGREQVMGNVQESTLAEILAGEQLSHYWGLTKDQVDVCKDCEYRYACGDCRPAAIGTSGDLYAKYPRCTYDPYQGEWKPLEEIPGITDLSKESGDQNENELGHKTQSTSWKARQIQSTQPKISLVTDNTISMEGRYRMYVCDPG